MALSEAPKAFAVAREAFPFCRRLFLSFLVAVKEKGQKYESDLASNSFFRSCHFSTCFSLLASKEKKTAVCCELLSFDFKEVNLECNMQVLQSNNELVMHTY